MFRTKLVRNGNNSTPEATKKHTVLTRTRRVGSVEPGKLADLIAVRGNPLTDLASTPIELSW